MRAIQIALLFILINLSASIVVKSDLFSSGLYYESELLKNIESKSQTSISEISITNVIEQLSTQWTGLNLLLSALSFNWIYGLVPHFISSNTLFQYIVSSLNIVLWLLIIVAVIELISKRWGILKA